MAADTLLGDTRISDRGPPVFFPDIDVYFKGRVSLALSLLEQLKQAGASVVKGALIHDIRICFDGDIDATYFRPGHGMVSERYRKVLERHLLPLADAAVIYRRAHDLGLATVLTVYDVDGADFAVDSGVAALKVASSNITHAPLIRHLARKRLPLVIDTGRAGFDEIARAVCWARDAGAGELVVQHSPAGPPAPLDQHHLRMMPALGQAFGCAYGLSDHHAGTEMMLAATALGASVIEKGICADDATDDIDLAHAARIGDVAAILRGIDSVWRALGSTMRELPPGRARPVDRMGLLAARPLAAGERLTPDAVRFALAVPAATIGTEDWDRVDGKMLSSPVAEGQPLSWSDVRLDAAG